MKILRRKDKLNKTITVRVPEAIKGELHQLRERADAAGFDVGATLRESLTVTIRQMSAELDALEHKHQVQVSDVLPNSLDHDAKTSDG